MTRTVRAVGLAAAAFLLAASFGGSPLKAWKSETPSAATHFLDHGIAGAEVSDLGLNGDDAAAQSARGDAIGALAEHLVALADATLPRPRTLPELVDAYAAVATDDAQEDCLASAVYFEARGEPIEGQLAVAEVVLNRVASSRYPETICDVVVQPWQFSFVNRTRSIPPANRASEAWRRAVAVAKIAEAGASRLLPADVLWYHADYVSPGWGRRLARNAKIGLHIFYS